MLIINDLNNFYGTFTDYWTFWESEWVVGNLGVAPLLFVRSMDHSLYQQFSGYFPHFSRGVVKNFLLLAQALLASPSTNLNTVKDRIGPLLGKADRQPATHYKRLIRFFRCSQAALLTECIQRFTFCLLKGQVNDLILDSTCWEIGQKWVHLQVLCVVYQQIAIPIFWRSAPAAWPKSRWP